MKNEQENTQHCVEELNNNLNSFENKRYNVKEIDGTNTYPVDNTPFVIHKQKEKYLIVQGLQVLQIHETMESALKEINEPTWDLILKATYVADVYFRERNEELNNKTKTEESEVEDAN